MTRTADLVHSSARLKKGLARNTTELDHGFIFVFIMIRKIALVLLGLIAIVLLLSRSSTSQNLQRSLQSGARQHEDDDPPERDVHVSSQQQDTAPSCVFRSFETRVLVEFAGNATTIDESDDLIDAFRQAYAASHNCTSGERILEKIEIVSNTSMLVGPHLFAVVGRCAGCNDSFAFFSSPSNQTRRALQAAEPCNCGGPPETLFVNAYNSSLQSIRQPGNVSEGVLEVSTATELDQIPCPEQLTEFQSYVAVSLSAGVDLDPMDATLVESSLVESYALANSLNPDLCDETFRTIKSVVLVSEEQMPDNVLLFRVGATCSGCNEALHDVAPMSKRRLGGGFAIRRLQQGESCYCPPQVERRGPTIEEVGSYFNATLSALQAESQLQSISSVVLVGVEEVEEGTELSSAPTGPSVPTPPEPTVLAPILIQPTTVLAPSSNLTDMAPIVVRPTILETPSPVTPAPVTSAPVTAAPFAETSAPATPSPITLPPTTFAPTTLMPTTPNPTLAAPTTIAPNTSPPFSQAPGTLLPTTPGPTTPRDIPPGTDTDCNRVEFDRSIIVQLNINFPLNETEFSNLAEVVRTTYSGTHMCDEGQRVVESVHLDLDDDYQGLLPSVNPLSVRFRLVGFCEGCEEESFSLFRIENAAGAASESRRLQDNTAACECQGPLLAEFSSLLAARIALSQQSSNLDSVDSFIKVEEAVNVVCGAPGATFQTAVIINFQSSTEVDTSNVTVLEALSPEIQIVAQSFADVFNRLNRYDDGNCDAPYFRLVQNVSFVSTPFTYRNRRLQQDSFRFSLSFNINGLCRGCSPDTKLFSNSRRQRLLSANHLHQRVLQDSGTCYCSPEAESGPPDTARFTEQLVDRLDSLATSNELQSISGIADFEELVSADCSSDVVMVSKILTIDLAGAPSLTSEQLVAFQDDVKNGYNTLKGPFFCDPLFRVVQDVEFFGVETSPEDVASYNFRVRVRCRGCTDADPLLDGIRRSLRKMVSPPNMNRQRRDQEEGACFCAVGAVDGNPDATLYRIVLEADLGTNSVLSGLVLTIANIVESPDPQDTGPVSVADPTSAPGPQDTGPASVADPIPAPEPPDGGLPIAGQWSRLSEPFSPESSADSFGFSVSMSGDGNTVAIGSPSFARGTGRVQVFRLSEAWLQLGDGITVGDGAFQLGFKTAISMNGQIVAISGFQGVWVYQFDGFIWSQLGNAISESLTPVQGLSLSMAGDVIAVGHPNGGSEAGGSVQVYEYSGGSWQQRGGDLEGSGNFGASVALSGDGSIVAVSGPLRDDGYVQVYSFGANEWTQLGGELSGGTISRFGGSISISGDGSRLAVGSLNDAAATAANPAQGVVRVYEFSNDNWTLLGAEISNESGDGTGSSISLSSDGFLLAIGRPGFSNGNGGVSTFLWQQVAWVQVGEVVRADHLDGPLLFGRSVSLSMDGTRMICGSQNTGATAFEATPDSGAPITTAPNTPVPIADSGAPITTSPITTAPIAFNADAGAPVTASPNTPVPIADVSAPITASPNTPAPIVFNPSLASPALASPALVSPALVSPAATIVVAAPSATMAPIVEKQIDSGTKAPGTVSPVTTAAPIFATPMFPPMVSTDNQVHPTTEAPGTASPVVTAPVATAAPIYVTLMLPPIVSTPDPPSPPVESEVVNFFVISNTAGLDAASLNSFTTEHFELIDAYNALSQRIFEELYPPKEGVQRRLQLQSFRNRRRRLANYRWFSGGADFVTGTECPSSAPELSLCHNVTASFKIITDADEDASQIISEAQAVMREALERGDLQCELENGPRTSLLRIETGGGCSATTGAGNELLASSEELFSTFVISNTVGMTFSEVVSAVEARSDLTRAYEQTVRGVMDSLFSKPSSGRQLTASYALNSSEIKNFVATTCPASSGVDAICHSCTASFKLDISSDENSITAVQTARSAVQEAINTGVLYCEFQDGAANSDVSIETGADADCDSLGDDPTNNWKDDIAIGGGVWTPLDDTPLTGFVGNGTTVSFNSDGSVLAVASSTGVQVYAFLDEWKKVGGEITISSDATISVDLNEKGSVVGIGLSGGEGNGVSISVHRFDGSSWVQLGRDIRAPNGESDYGSTIVLSSIGTVVATSSPSHGEGLGGGAFVYAFEGGAWNQVGATIAGSSGDSLGGALAMNHDGTIVAAAGPQRQDGFVAVYRYDGDSWKQLGTDIVPDIATARFGASIALSNEGTALVVGSPGENTGDTNDQSFVRVMDFVGDEWVPIAPDLREEKPLDGTGAMVALSGNGRVVTFGRPGANNGKGQVLTVRWNAMEWVRIGGLVENMDGSPTDWGSSFAFSRSSNRLAVSTGNNEVHTFEMRAKR